MAQQQIIITTADTLKLFEGIASSMVGFDTCTIPDLLGGKANPMKGRIRKCTTMVAILGETHDYAQKVTRLAQKETDKIWENVELMPFKAESLWKGKGAHVAGAVIRHIDTNDRYIMYYPHPKFTPKVHYELDGVFIAKQDIEGLNEKTREGKTVEVEGQKMVLPVFATTLKIESVKRFRINGVEYIIQ